MTRIISINSTAEVLPESQLRFRAHRAALPPEDGRHVAPVGIEPEAIKLPYLNGL